MANDDVLKKLTAQWYNAFSTVMGQSTSNFQIFQPFVPLPEASGKINLPSYMNLIPKESLTYQGAAGLKFYEGFRGLLAYLKPTEEIDFEKIIGKENWNKFTDYIFNQEEEIPTSKWPKYFKKWAFKHCPSKANVGASAIARLILEPVASAQTVMTDVYSEAEGAPRPATWQLGYEELLDVLGSAPELSMTFSSETANSNINETWAKGKIGLKTSIFSGSASTEVNKITSKFSSSSIEIEGKFDHITTFMCLPGTWYGQGAAHLAFSRKEGKPWTQNIWGDFFGEKGQLKRFAVNLLVCSGMDLTVKSKISVTETEKQTIKAKAKAGFWPFYVKAEGKITNTTSFEDGGKLVMNIKSPKNIPLILGLNQMPASQYIGDTYSIADLQYNLLQSMTAAKIV